MKGRPGAAYVDLPADVLMAPAVGPDAATAALANVPAAPAPAACAAAAADVAAAAQLLARAARPLVVVGKGAALGRAETQLREVGGPSSFAPGWQRCLPGLHNNGRQCANNAARTFRCLALASSPLTLLKSGAPEPPRLQTSPTPPGPQLVSRFSLPFLATSMGRGVVPDDSPLCVNAARSMALAQADVALVVGAR